MKKTLLLTGVAGFVIGVAVATVLLSGIETIQLNEPPPSIHSIENTERQTAGEVSNNGSPASDAYSRLKSEHITIREIEAKSRERQQRFLAAHGLELKASGAKRHPGAEQAKRKRRARNPVTAHYAKIEDIHDDIFGAVLEKAAQRTLRIGAAIADFAMQEEFKTLGNPLTEKEEQILAATSARDNVTLKQALLVGDWLGDTRDEAEQRLASGFPENREQLLSQIAWINSAAEELHIPLDSNSKEWVSDYITFVEGVTRESRGLATASDPFAVAVFNGDIDSMEKLLAEESVSDQDIASLHSRIAEMPESSE